MKIKTSELTGAALDWAVAKCEGVDYFWLQSDEFKPQYESGEHHYSSNWAQGGPIIERERIELELGYNGSYEGEPTCWRATRIKKPYVSVAEGPTPLIAAMRCYVASQLGDEVDIPEELE